MSDKTFFLENYELGEEKTMKPDCNINNQCSAENQINRIVKQVQRQRQKQRDDELWEKHCEKNILVSITGGYVVKDNSYPSILLPDSNADSHKCLFNSGAVTIISDDSLRENVSKTESNITTKTTSSYTSFKHNDDIIFFKSNENKKDVILELNKVNEEHVANVLVANEKINIDNAIEQDLRKTNSNYSTSNKFSSLSKLASLRNKIYSALNDIINLWDVVPIIDGVEDLQRRKKRASEFAIRFSRIYLYNLGIQIKDLRKLLRHATARSCFKLQSEIVQKLFKTHSIITQGLRAYYKHMPSSTAGPLPDKIKQFIKYSCDLWKICKKNDILKPLLYNSTDNDTCIEDIEDKCNCIIQKIDDTEEKKKSNEIKPTSCCNKNIKKSQKDKKINKKYNKLSNRLSMYTLELSKRPSQIYKRNCFHTTTSKTNIKLKSKKIDKKEDVKLSDASKTTNIITDTLNQVVSQDDTIPLKKKKSEIISVPPKEDDIITQMDILNQRDLNIIESDKAEGKEEENSGNFTRDLSKNEYNNSLRQLLIEILRNIDNQNEKETENSSLIELKNVLTEIKQFTDIQNSKEIANDNDSRTEQRTKTTSVQVIGPRNAKLICLSPVQSEGSVEKSSEINQSTHHQHHQSIGTNTNDIKKASANSLIISNRKKLTSSDRLEILKNTNSISSRKDIIRSNAPKKYIKKINLPRSIIRNINKYNDLFTQFTRKDNMYIVRKNKKPWQIVSRIADGLLDLMVSNILEELEIDQFLVKLYEMELK